MRILAVDDDVDFLAVFSTVLGELGYDDHLTALSAAEAMMLIQDPDEVFECFILDVQMPEMDGIELTRRIREIGAYRDTPIVMNTAIADREHIDRAFSAGATDYLTKPVDPVEIEARLGVIEQLVVERRRWQDAQTKSNAAPAAPSPNFEFMDGIPLKRVKGAVDIFTMANYLKSLGMFRALTVAAVGVRVTNARYLYNLEGGQVFGEVIVDVATCIADCFETSNHMIAYAGGGVFVCLMPRAEVGDPDALADRLHQYIGEFEQVYAELDIQMPVIAVGLPVKVGAAQLSAPMRIIDDAIASVNAIDTYAATMA